MRLNQTLRAVMADAGETQESLASAIGMSQKWLSRRLTGEVELKLSELQKIANALDIPIIDLIEEQPAPLEAVAA